MQQPGSSVATADVFIEASPWLVAALQAALDHGTCQEVGAVLSIFRRGASTVSAPNVLAAACNVERAAAAGDRVTARAACLALQRETCGLRASVR